MQLKRITGQSNGLSNGLRQFYEPGQRWGEEWTERLEAMRTLVAHLEEAVEYPPQWVLTSHEDLILAGQDDYETWLVSVHPCQRNGVSPANARYKIRSRSAAPWSDTVGFANDERTAGEMIVEALSHVR